METGGRVIKSIGANPGLILAVRELNNFDKSEGEMISRAALLYLSQKHELKSFFSKFPGFKQITRRFIAGENIDDAIRAFSDLGRAGISATFDHLGEGATSQAEAESDVREYLRALDRIQSHRHESGRI